MPPFFTCLASPFTAALLRGHSFRVRSAFCRGSVRATVEQLAFSYLARLPFACYRQAQRRGVCDTPGYAAVMTERRLLFCTPFCLRARARVLRLDLSRGCGCAAHQLHRLNIQLARAARSTVVSCCICYRFHLPSCGRAGCICDISLPPAFCVRRLATYAHDTSTGGFVTVLPRRLTGRAHSTATYAVPRDTPSPVCSVSHMLLPCDDSRPPRWVRFMHLHGHCTHTCHTFIRRCPVHLLCRTPLHCTWPAACCYLYVLPLRIRACYALLPYCLPAYRACLPSHCHAAATALSAFCCHCLAVPPASYFSPGLPSSACMLCLLTLPLVTCTLRPLPVQPVACPCPFHLPVPHTPLHTHIVPVCIPILFLPATITFALTLRARSAGILRRCVDGSLLC